jgi:hypothetical protein
MRLIFSKYRILQFYEIKQKIIFIKNPCFVIILFKTLAV